MKRAFNYIAARNLSFEDHLRDWAAHAERKFEARMLDGGADLELSILDVIGYPWVSGSITADMVKKALDRHPAARRISVLINSPGGICSEGVAIYNLLDRHPAEVSVEIIGEAASAASLVAMAGTTIRMRAGTWMMVHPAQCAAMGNADDMRKAAEYLDTCTASAIEIYQRRTGRSQKEVAKLVTAETWMTAAQAIEAGFANAVVDGKAPPVTETEEPSSPDPLQVTIDMNVSTAERRNGLPGLAWLGNFGVHQTHQPKREDRATMKLTHEEAEVCKHLGLAPATFLERKAFEERNPTNPFAVNVGTTGTHDVEAAPTVRGAGAALLSADELGVCQQLGVDPVQFAERKTFEQRNPNTPFAVNVGGAAL